MGFLESLKIRKLAWTSVKPPTSRSRAASARLSAHERKGLVSVGLWRIVHCNYTASMFSLENEFGEVIPAQASLSAELCFDVFAKLPPCTFCQTLWRLRGISDPTCGGLTNQAHPGIVLDSGHSMVCGR